MNADGSGQQMLARYSVRLTFAFTEPSWSPDGRKIAFWKGDRALNKEIYIIDADGSGQQRLTRNPAPDISPDWQPARGRKG